MIKRIKSLISVKNLTASQFADLLGVQRSNISHILSGRNKPSLDFILKINEHFPTVSNEWLLKGQGEMFTQEEKRTKIVPSQLEIQEFDSRIEETIKPIPDTNGVISEEKDIEKKIPAAMPESIPDLVIEQASNENSASLSTIDSGIEQVMVLFKNGSFRVYNPQK